MMFSVSESIPPSTAQPSSKRSIGWSSGNPFCELLFTSQVSASRCNWSIATRARRFALVGLSTAAVLFTYFLLDGYMRDVAPYWSQKDLIATYYRNRASPVERLIAYQMYWRGETFYTKNEIYEGPTEDRTVFDQEGADDKLKEWISRNRGHRHFFLYERGQQGHLQQLLPIESQASFKVLDEMNNKFSVAQADL